jgi:hypothetical protein
MRPLSHQPNQKLIAGAYKNPGGYAAFNNAKRLAFCEPLLRVGWRFCFVRRVDGQVFYLRLSMEQRLARKPLFQIVFVLSTYFIQVPVSSYIYL